MSHRKLKSFCDKLTEIKLVLISYQFGLDYGNMPSTETERSFSVNLTFGYNRILPAARKF